MPGMHTEPDKTTKEVESFVEIGMFFVLSQLPCLWLQLKHMETCRSNFNSGIGVCMSSCNVHTQTANLVTCILVCENLACLQWLVYIFGTYIIWVLYILDETPQLLFSVCFSVATSLGWLLFEGGIHSVGKPVDSNKVHAGNTARFDRWWQQFMQPLSPAVRNKYYRPQQTN